MAVLHATQSNRYDGVLTICFFRTLEPGSPGGAEHQNKPKRPAAIRDNPLLPRSQFVDRDDILERIHQRCSDQAGRMALVGLGGVGKSQLAIEYSHRVALKQANRWVFWVYAGTQARIEQGFRTIADDVKLPGRKQPKADVAQLVQSWLSNERNGRWIIILDNADDSDALYTVGDDREGRPLASCLPRSRNGSILVMIRSKELTRRLTGGHKNMIEIGPMEQGDALAHLKKLGSLRDSDTAAELVRALEYVPLAICHAAAYIQERAPEG